MSDFDAEAVARQVPALTEMLAAGNPAASAQLDEILHAPEFQRLEARWRGLRYLLRETETSENLKILVLNAAMPELLLDFREAPELRESAVFRQVEELRYGVLRAEPFGLLIGDYEFSNEPDDLELLERMAQVAAAAHAPFIASASARMFGWEDFTQMPCGTGIAKIFEDEAYCRWRSFRETEESRYAALVLPRMLLRLPYGDATVPVRAFSYQENVGDDDHRKLLWGNTAYALGARIAEAFRRHHWCAAIRGIESGGLVEYLPVHRHQDRDGEVLLSCPTEVGILDIPEHELGEAGFVGLVQCKNSDVAVFFSVFSCRRVEPQGREESSVAARLSARLEYIMVLSRFAHYLKAMVRDRFEAFRSAEECSRFLNGWIADYVIEDDEASPMRKAMFPLREARIEVEEAADHPGRFRATAFLRPHHQLIDPGTPLRLVVELPPTVRGLPPT
jgi:type VI secretion system protein ImpC